MPISQNQPTIIMAAHNEASVIDQTLTSLTETDAKPSFQVIVICNGCNDGTEDIVRTRFPTVHCLTLKDASKARAIRFAESHEPGFPRLYLDADINMPHEQAAKLLKLGSQKSEPQLTIPASHVNTDSSSIWVKHFYNVWYASRFVQSMGYGAGAYLVNKEGRRRFDAWPDLIADDAFIRSRFSQNEIVIEKSINVHVTAPKNLWSLIKIKTRSKLGNFELKKYLDEAAPSRQFDLPNEQQQKEPVTAINHSNVLAWHTKCSYILVNGIAWIWAKWQFTTGNRTWLRDDSNR